MAHDLATAATRGGYAHDGDSGSARVFPNGQEPAKGNQSGGKPLQSGTTELTQSEPHG